MRQYYTGLIRLFGRPPDLPSPTTRAHRGQAIRSKSGLPTGRQAIRYCPCRGSLPNPLHLHPRLSSINQPQFLIMEKKDLYFHYQESGKINPLGLVMAYGICAALGIFLGYIYSLIVILLPLVYINFLITCGFGLILGVINRIVVRLTHNRNKKSQLVLALFSGLLSTYFQWIAYLLFAIDGEIPSLSLYLSNLHWIVYPQELYALVAELNSIGLWSIFGAPLNGPVLTFIWFLEAFIIIGMPIIAVYKTKVYPYSEFLGDWYPKFTLHHHFESIATVNKLLTDLQRDTLSAIKALGNGTGNRHTKIHVFYAKDEDKQYLTFEKIFIEGQGTGKTISTVLINNFTIDRKTAESILANFDHKREKTEII
jgi:hypothetical protein